MNLESLFGKIMVHTLTSVWKVIPFTSYRLCCVNCFLLPKPRRASQAARQTSSMGIVMVILQWVCNFAVKVSFHHQYFFQGPEQSSQPGVENTARVAVSTKFFSTPCFLPHRGPFQHLIFLDSQFLSVSVWLKVSLESNWAGGGQFMNRWSWKILILCSCTGNILGAAPGQPFCSWQKCFSELAASGGVLVCSFPSLLSSVPAQHLHTALRGHSEMTWAPMPTIC